MLHIGKVFGNEWPSKGNVTIAALMFSGLYKFLMIASNVNSPWMISSEADLGWFGLNPLYFEGNLERDLQLQLALNHKSDALAW
ncbi:hypothetical protein GOP47_0020807 [Adiantum capillus-veneris]|uniref:Uncharacterized protein n=1 Tax=Adiantum capillus-veneris TaxID=13818 RepID=A0A9D4UAN0_ADICA|nr:hypothetical protein GOP47_0020807 [Adiantum capillus-veneris]